MCSGVGGWCREMARTLGYLGSCWKNWKKRRKTGNIQKWAAFLLGSNPEIKSSEVFTKEAIKFYQEIFVWAVGRLTELMHCLDDFSIDVPYLCHRVPKFANCHHCCFEITWRWNSRQLFHCPFILLYQIIFQINHVTKCVSKSNGLKSETRELLVWWELLV